METFKYHEILHFTTVLELHYVLTMNYPIFFFYYDNIWAHITSCKFSVAYSQRNYILGETFLGMARSRKYIQVMISVNINRYVITLPLKQYNVFDVTKFYLVFQTFYLI